MMHSFEFDEKSQLEKYDSVVDNLMFDEGVLDGLFNGCSIEKYSDANEIEHLRFFSTDVIENDESQEEYWDVFEHSGEEMSLETLLDFEN